MLALAQGDSFVAKTTGAEGHMISKGGLNGQNKKDKLSGTPKRRKGERNAPATAKGMIVPRYFTRV
ncbi:MAG: hypothetical protein ACXVDD_29140, partial [Polyangia bacterium]